MCICPSVTESLHHRRAAWPLGVLAVPYLWVEDTAWDRSLWSQRICFYEALQILIRGRGKSPQARARPEARKSGLGRPHFLPAGPPFPQMRWAV